MKTILITGVAGFIGSNLAKYFLENTDYKVIGIDNLQGGTKIYDTFILDLVKKYKNFITIVDDIKNINDFSYNIDFVFHLAATPRVSYSVEYPLKTNENNISNSLILLDWCVKHKVRRLVFSSSSSVYGDVDIFPTPENALLCPNSPYALQKRTIEEYCRLYSRLYNLDTISLRYFNVYGQNQYASNAYATVICAWIDGLISNKQIRLDGDGTQSRDFTYVTDVCFANRLVAEHKDRFDGEIFNVGRGDSVSLLEIKNIIEKYSNKKADILCCGSRAGDVRKTQADATKIEKLGFQSIINIEDGIKLTYEWYKSVK